MAQKFLVRSKNRVFFEPITLTIFTDVVIFIALLTFDYQFCGSSEEMDKDVAAKDNKPKIQEAASYLPSSAL